VNNILIYRFVLNVFVAVRKIYRYGRNGRYVRICVASVASVAVKKKIRS